MIDPSRSPEGATDPEHLCEATTARRERGRGAGASEGPDGRNLRLNEKDERDEGERQLAA